jgi:hypothetical protein
MATPILVKASAFFSLLIKFQLLRNATTLLGNGHHVGDWQTFKHFKVVT